MPLPCWRYKLRFGLHRDRIRTQEEQSEKGSFVSPLKRRKVDETLAFQQFLVVDGWRGKLNSWVEEESGSYNSTDKQWVRNFYEFETY